MVAFLVPFFFVLEPSLLGRGAPLDIMTHGLFAAVGSFLLACGLFGFMREKLNLGWRAIYLASGIALLYPDVWLSLAGLSVAVLAYISESALAQRKSRRGWTGM